MIATAVRIVRSLRPKRPSELCADHGATRSRSSSRGCPPARSAGARARSPRRRGTARGRRSTRPAASCVTITIVCPRSVVDARSSSRISWPVFESRFPVGSSANTTVGCATSARAIATRCCWPPESSDGRWLFRSVSPTRSIRSLKNAGSGFSPAIESGSRTFSSRRQHREQVEELEDEADVLAPEQGHLAVGEAADVLAGDRDGAARRLVERREEVHERRLAGAGRPHHCDELARCDARARPPQRVDGGLALAVAAGEVCCGDDCSVAVHVSEATDSAQHGDIGVVPRSTLGPASTPRSGRTRE